MKAKPQRKQQKIATSPGKAGANNKELTMRNLHGVEQSFYVIADSLKELIAYVDSELRFRFANQAYQRFFAEPGEDLTGGHFAEIVGAEGYRILGPYIQKAVLGKPARYEGWLTSGRRNERRYVRIDYIPEIGVNGQVLGVFIIRKDLTDLKRAERHFQAIVESAPDGIIMMDPSGKIVLVNAHAEQMLGYARDELAGQPLEMLMPERFRSRHVAHRGEYMRQPVARTMAAGLELYALRKDGTEFPVDITLSPIETSEGMRAVAIMRDVTVHRQLLEKQKETALLEERNRVARDVHDTLAQGFAGITLHLEGAEDALADDPKEVRHHIRRARELARRSLEEARRSVLAMRPASAKNLVSVLREMVAAINPGTRAQVEFSLRGIYLPHSLEVEENLQRICQEALSNALRHARAEHIRVELEYDSQQTRLCVSDDGKGLALKRRRPGFGLISLQERAKQIGARLVHESSRGKGTRVEVTVPAGAKSDDGARS
ncbi:MAG TPA: PAS domain S-box protein [Terriglobales bacterium]|nr:PAS domain S-box protein [Terriglobales bacterium]